ncbi:MAG TPA: hypothetical protein VJ908_04800 [Wenzhouxiangellaceae bacterium]|nr:hypothetical protein [Wenzhouxiangellaceae bacterium]
MPSSLSSDPRNAMVEAMPESFNYRIDRDNVLVSVSENWNSFAADNAGASMSAADVVGRALDQFIADEETRALYALVLDSVRGSNRAIAFRFRCDSPTERRFCELRISAGGDGSVDFESRILLTESRHPVPLLEADEQRDPDEFLKACSVCKRIAADQSEWIEIEAAMERLQLDQRQRIPRITHGLCADCHAGIIATL